MRFPIADAHCDFLYGAMEYGYDINSLRRDQVIHLPYMRQGNVKLQLFACWYDSKLKTPPLQQGLASVARSQAQHAQSMHRLIGGQLLLVGSIRHIEISCFFHFWLLLLFVRMEDQGERYAYDQGKGGEDKPTGGPVAQEESVVPTAIVVHDLTCRERTYRGTHTIGHHHE